MNDPESSIPSSIFTWLFLISLTILMGCTTSGYLNAVNPYTLAKGIPKHTPFRKAAFRTSYSNVSWEQKSFEGENGKYASASCEVNYRDFSDLSFIRSITGLEREDIREIQGLERVDPNICRFFAVLITPTNRASTRPESAGEATASYLYFYWREQGSHLIVFGDYNKPWKDVYAKDTLEEFMKTWPAAQ